MRCVRDLDALRTATRMLAWLTPARDIEVFRVPCDELLQAMLTGRVLNAKPVIAITTYKLHLLLP